MKMSMGSDLLRLISQSDAVSETGRNPKANKVIRNFNFKTNVAEIDKIIEEHDESPSKDPPSVPSQHS